MIYWITDFEATEEQLAEVEGVCVAPEIIFATPYPGHWIVVYNDDDYPDPPDWLDGYPTVPIPGSPVVYVPGGTEMYLGSRKIYESGNTIRTDCAVRTGCGVMTCKTQDMDITVPDCCTYIVHDLIIDDGVEITIEDGGELLCV